MSKYQENQSFFFPRIQKSSPALPFSAIAFGVPFLLGVLLVEGIHSDLKKSLVGNLLGFVDIAMLVRFLELDKLELRMGRWIDYCVDENISLRGGFTRLFGT
jgi:hypothetical protein